MLDPAILFGAAGTGCAAGRSLPGPCHVVWVAAGTIERHPSPPSRRPARSPGQAPGGRLCIGSLSGFCDPSRPPEDGRSPPPRRPTAPRDHRDKRRVGGSAWGLCRDFAIRASRPRTARSPPPPPSNRAERPPGQAPGGRLCIGSLSGFCDPSLPPGQTPAGHPCRPTAPRHCSWVCSGFCEPSLPPPARPWPAGLASHHRHAPAYGRCGYPPRHSKNAGGTRDGQEVRWMH